MIIIGVDYHPSVQQIAWLDTATGECGERRLMHSAGEAERFYRELKQRGVSVRIGIEATGHALVRAAAGGTGFRAVDWRPSPDQSKASPEAEDGQPGRSTSVDATGGKSFSSSVGTESGKPGSAATTLASASTGANADADHESAAGRCPERRYTPQEGTVEQVRASAIGVVLARSLGHAAPARPAGTAGSAKP